MNRYIGIERGFNVRGIGVFNYEEFVKWLDGVFNKEFPCNTVAINFNLYEEMENDTWAVQIIGSDRFDEEDWACYETFSTGEDLYIWREEGDWEKALETAMYNLKKYLKNGKYSSVLMQYNGIGIGFVDGDIEIVYRR